MGREVRRVPADWTHPKDKYDNPIPMHNRSYREAAEKWVKEFKEWDAGTHPDQDGNTECRFYWEWAGAPPEEECCRPEFTSEPTHYQMYESVSEGTPISPVFATLEELAHWLADNKANAGMGRTATYEQWLSVCKAGFAPTMVTETGKDGAQIMSGVEFMGKQPR